MSILNANSDHPIHKKLEGSYEKFLVMVMRRYGIEKFTVTERDIQALADLPEMPCIITHVHKTSIDLMLVALSVGEAYAKEHNDDTD